MPAVTQHFICEPGADFSRVVTLKDAPAGNLINLTGSSAVAQVWTAVGGTKLLDLTVTLGGAAGTITISATKTQTAAIVTTALSERTVTELIDVDGSPLQATGPTAVYSLEITFADGEVQRLLVGDFCLPARTIA